MLECIRNSPRTKDGQGSWIDSERTGRFGVSEIRNFQEKGVTDSATLASPRDSLQEEKGKGSTRSLWATGSMYFIVPKGSFIPGSLPRFLSHTVLREACNKKLGRSQVPRLQILKGLWKEQCIHVINWGVLGVVTVTHALSVQSLEGSV